MSYIRLKDLSQSYVDPLKYSDVWSDYNGGHKAEQQWMIRGNKGIWYYASKEARDSDYERFTSQLKGGTMNSIKDYFNKHRDVLFTIFIVILIDHFVFNGVFREKIQALVDRFLSRAHKQLDRDDAAVGAVDGKA